ncbi:Cobyric acid synthase [Candidatus Methanobinarius endosymbioticus]|uniref:Lipid II isoglutaminyl synthase (glutamine-hydrolyzing) subunit GatD n=1 Tax=Candidatus Methanobinarius endosymbioticus TaxID=2006182 RepID=A0A366ME57_9EURY|nr:Cobyric acid synthase [Candidatus Methanobinarius endosymbioticus]
MKLEIVNMYPDILNLYGDIGNLICIKKRCEWRGIEVDVKDFTIDKELDFQNFDMVLIGGGSDNGQNIISNHILDQRNSLETFIEDEKVLLAICGSHQMFGNYYVNPYNEKIPCLEIFDIETKSRKDRLTGNILISNNLKSNSIFDSVSTHDFNDIIGFENHGGRTYHSYDTLGDVQVGHGNNGEDGKEGMLYKNFIGSYLHGPILSKNPHLADIMIFNALKNKYDIDDIKKSILEINYIDDSIEINAHNNMKQKILKL